MTRFMAPRYFTPQQSDAVTQALETLDIGDDEGARIFIIALEYELAEFESLATSGRPEKQERKSPELENLSRDITAVARQLEYLPENSRLLLLDRLTEQDPFNRVHDKAYLGAVVAELTRIASVCGDAQQAVAAETGLSEAEKHFIGVIAEAYYECFEALPGNGGGEPFTSLLQRIVEISGLNISLSKKELDPILASIG